VSDELDDGPVDSLGMVSFSPFPRGPGAEQKTPTAKSGPGRRNTETF